MIKRLVKVSLPSEYQQVEYLESTGTQYIDTGIMYDIGVNIKTEFSVTDNSNFNYNEELFGYGNIASAPHKSFNVLNHLATWWKENDWKISNFSIAKNIFYTLETYTKDFSLYFKINDSVQLIGDDYGRTDASCYVFGIRNYNNTNPFNLGCWRIKYFQMIKGNNVLIHLIPCYRKADNVAGMYDVISNTFFTNSGTGEFIVGNFNTETLVTNRDVLNIDTITSTETIAYTEKEHIDYDGSVLEKKVTVTKPCKIYLCLWGKNSEQIPNKTIPMPYMLNYEILVNGIVYDNFKPNVTEKSGDFNCVIIDVTKDMLTSGSYTFSFIFRAHMYPNYPVKELEQILHLETDIYYQPHIKVMKEIKTIKRIHTLLPKEYQQVEYLESTGTQYIDTNYIPNSNTSIKLSFQITKSQEAGIIGSGEEWNTVDNFIFGPSYGDCFWGYAGGANNIRLWQSNYNFTDTYNVYMDITKFIVESNSVEYTANTDKTEIINPTRSIYIFKANTENGNLKNGSSIKLFKTEIYENDILIQNYIPCYRKADNVAGMYDLISDQFFTNSGTGEFIVGSVVLKEIKTIKRYIPNVGLVTLFGNNLFELRKFVSFDANYSMSN